MTVKEEIKCLIDQLADDDLQSVLDYLRALGEPPEVEATEEERAAIARGRAEFERGEFVAWQPTKGK